MKHPPPSVLIVNGSGTPSLTDPRLLPRGVTIACCRYPGGPALMNAKAVIVEVDRSDAERALRLVRSMDRRTRVMLLVRESSEQLAIAALNAGVTRYVTMAAPPEDVHEAITAVLAGTDDHASAPCGARGDPLGADRLVGDSAPMRRLRSEVERAAKCQSNVLITGETGTGKELVAELIHANSTRRHAPFVCLNSTAIPDALVESELFGYERGAFTGAYASNGGKLAAANRGTVFFDEIGDISASVQAKLLRALDGKTIYRLGGDKAVPLDVRVVTATNQDLEEAVRTDRFRRDLYYRLNVVRLEVPPLRERPDDVVLLLEHFIRFFNSAFGVNALRFDESALDALVRHEWPGNVRELKNVVEAAFANLPDFGATTLQLPPPFRRAATGPDTERSRVIAALMACDWNKSRAADQLHWSRMTLYRKLKRLKISTPGAS